MVTSTRDRLFDDPAEVFDHLLALSASRVSTATSGTSLRARKLPLRKEPQAKFLPEKHREIAAVPENVKAAFRSLVSGKSPWPLFLWGEPGRGKTCAALALCDYLRSEQVQFTTIADLTARVMDSWKSTEKFEWKPFGPFRDRTEFYHGTSGSWLVVLDELGTRSNVTDTHYECVQRVLDMREGWPLILISNKDIAGIGQLYDARIASRCEAGTVVEMKGMDRRLL